MRTEKDVLREFEKLGYAIEEFTPKSIYRQRTIIIFKRFKDEEDQEELIKEIKIFMDSKCYKCIESIYYSPISTTLKEHKLLNELFSIWGWL